MTSKEALYKLETFLNEQIERKFAYEKSSPGFGYEAVAEGLDIALEKLRQLKAEVQP